MGGRFSQIKTAQGNKSECIERTCTGTKKAIIKTDATTRNEGERHRRQAALLVDFT
ncbi:Uncharacterised protein [Yersinia enterocolitica]|nr:Uncharacterised protein [Yersinia enterocolitica]